MIYLQFFFFFENLQIWKALALYGWGDNLTLAALPRQRPGTRSTRGWVDPRTNLNTFGQSHPTWVMGSGIGKYLLELYR
jgi:hypothetical protein